MHSGAWPSRCGCLVWCGSAQWRSVRPPRPRARPCWWAATRNWLCSWSAGRRARTDGARWCWSAAKPALANPNQVTTPIEHSVSPDQTITVVDPRHPLCGRTLPLVAMTYHAQLGRCCVVRLRPNVERFVPVQATNLAFDPTTISPTPLSLSAVAQLLRVVYDIHL